MRLFVFAVLFGCRPSEDPSETGATPTSPSFDPDARWGPSDDWEPEIAADPGSAAVYQATTRITGRAQIQLRVSEDGGDTWGVDQVVSVGGDAYDPQLEVAADTGCVYVTFLGLGGWVTALRTSCDRGAGWTDPVPVAPGMNTDHAWLAVSPDGQDVYVPFNGGAGDVFGEGWVAFSHDGGVTFDQRQVTADPERYWFEDAAAIAPNGDVYVANVDYSQDYHGPATISLWRSTDRGDTWETKPIATSEEPAACEWAPGCEYGFFAAQVSLAVDRDGRLLVVWTANDAPGAPNRLWAAAGDDWDSLSAPVPLTDGAGEANFPLAAAGPLAGDFRVTWQGNLDPADPATFDTWYQETKDGGATFLAAPIDLSTAVTAPYQADGHYAFPYGDYGGLTVDGDGRAFAIWGEGPGWTGPGGTWSARQR